MLTTENTTSAPWAKEGEVEAGDTLVAIGFDCIAEGSHVEVAADGVDLFVTCSEGRHYLDGQLEDGEHYIGLVKATPAMEQDPSVSSLTEKPSC